MSYIQLANVFKFFGDLRIIDAVSLSVAEGEFVVLLGPSGCGKTTLLRLIAGLDFASAGEILVAGTRVEGPDKDRGLVFQNYFSFPWLRVRANIEFGMRLQGTPESVVASTASELIELVGLGGFEHHFPEQLSGGMQQRVAIARTLAINPKVLLLDEPFGALDPETRSSMQRVILDLWAKYRLTTLFVTHDVGEAIFLGQRLIISGLRPFAVRDEMSVPFGFPRYEELKTQDEFLDLEREVTYRMRKWSRIVRPERALEVEI